jgi:tRNA dimethylallyltransferase
MPSEGEGGRQWLKRRIARRFGQMMAEGALEEVRQLKSHLSLLEDLPPPPITRALGFQELSLCLEGQSTPEAAISHAITRSCQYAKRQCTWFRHQMPPHTLFLQPDQFMPSP